MNLRVGWKRVSEGDAVSAPGVDSGGQRSTASQLPQPSTRPPLRGVHKLTTP